MTTTQPPLQPGDIVLIKAVAGFSIEHDDGNVRRLTPLLKDGTPGYVGFSVDRVDWHPMSGPTSPDPDAAALIAAAEALRDASAGDIESALEVHDRAVDAYRAGQKAQTDGLASTLSHERPEDGPSDGSEHSDVPRASEAVEPEPVPQWERQFLGDIEAGRRDEVGHPVPDGAQPQPTDTLATGGYIPASSTVITVPSDGCIIPMAPRYVDSEGKPTGAPRIDVTTNVYVEHPPQPTDAPARRDWAGELPKLIALEFAYARRLGLERPGANHMANRLVAALRLHELEDERDRQVVLRRGMEERAGKVVEAHLKRGEELRALRVEVDRLQTDNAQLQHAIDAWRAEAAKANEARDEAAGKLDALRAGVAKEADALWAADPLWRYGYRTHASRLRALLDAATTDGTTTAETSKGDER